MNADIDIKLTDEQIQLLLQNTDLIKALREKFNNRLHIEEISYGAFAPIRVNIKGCLPKKQAEEIFYNIIPICHIWTYKQDKRIKQFKYVWRQESEVEK